MSKTCKECGQDIQDAGEIASALDTWLHHRNVDPALQPLLRQAIRELRKPAWRGIGPAFPAFRVVKYDPGSKTPTNAHVQLINRIIPVSGGFEIEII